MFLKMKTQMSFPKLMEELNGNIHYQMFCDILIDRVASLPGMFSPTYSPARRAFRPANGTKNRIPHEHEGIRLIYYAG